MMSPTEHLQHLAQCLAGVFQNREQALAEPAWFVHFRLWIYPISLFAEDSYTFFLEQASAAYAQPPYRQRVLRVRSLAEELTAEYYSLKDPLAFQGATQEPHRLKDLTVNSLQVLSGSRLRVTVQTQGQDLRYEARQYPGERCQFEVDGETKCVELAFDAIAPHASTSSGTAFWMYDKGLDPKTAKPIWGALNGPFKLLKIQDLSSEIGKLTS